MALTTEFIKREFILIVDSEEITLSDPNPRMTPDEVRKHYMGAYPSIVSASMEGPAVQPDGSVKYTIKSSPGTFG